MTQPAPRRSAALGFWDGARAPWQGLGFLLKTPASWPLAAVPALVALALMAGLSALAVAYLPDLVGGLVPASSSWYARAGRAVLEVLAVVAGVVLAALAGALLAQPLSGPALERLVRMRERSLGLPERPPTNFLTDAWRSARGALVGALSIPVLGALTLVEFLLPGSSVVILPLKVLVTGLFVSWDLLDYPMSVRNTRLRDRVAFLRRHLPLVWGFGVSLAVAFLIPCAQLLLLPAGVVGATALVRRAEELDRAGGLGAARAREFCKPAPLG